MNTYCKLKTGEIMVVYSDNQYEETMHLYPFEKEHTFDVEVKTVTKYPYSDIAVIDTNLAVLKTGESND